MKTNKGINDIISSNSVANKQIASMNNKIEKRITDKILHDAGNSRNTIVDKILEIYRRAPYRTTASGNRVAWDEPEKQREDEISDRIQRLMKTKRQLQQAKLAKDRLKNRNAIPQKAGKPMWEQQILDEDLNKAILLLRQYWHSSKVIRFREWCGMIEKIMDTLEN